MKTIMATPDTVGTAIRNLIPGSTLLLLAGKYTEPLVLKELSGEPGLPITIHGTPGAVFDGGMTFEQFEPRATCEAWRKLKNKTNRWPSLFHIAHEGMIQLLSCHHIVLENLNIRQCWPTAIYMNDVSDIRLDGLDIRDGTFAIYVEGDNSNHILVERSEWLQDVSQRKMWSELGWKKMHGNDKKINGGRAFDGAFFRTRNIRGNVIIRYNRVRHAANGVHMFNRRLGAGCRKGLNNNVQIYHNVFEHIRDNVVEPERRAVNWWFHHNTILNAHKWISLEMSKFGYIYIFANIGWWDDVPKPAGDHTGGAVFKFQESDKFLFKSMGKNYVFNNSWYLRSSYTKQGKFRDLFHWNNAVFHTKPDKTFFGDDPGFTNQWRLLNIEFGHDLVLHNEFPKHLISRGYQPINNGIQADPCFNAGATGDLTPVAKSPLIGKGRSMTIELPGNNNWHGPAKLDIGAYHNGMPFEGPAYVNFSE